MFEFSNEKTFLLLIIFTILVMAIWQNNSHQKELENFAQGNIKQGVLGSSSEHNTYALCNCNCELCNNKRNNVQSNYNDDGNSQHIITEHGQKPITINVDVNSRQPITLPPPPPPLDPYAPMRDFDYRALSDPLVPPLKRDDYNIPVLPLPTRGFPSSYKKMGTLVNKTADNTDPYKFLFLIGRQKYPGSDYYEYYCTEKGSEGNGALKFDLCDLKREVFSGDKITVKQLGTEYEVTADKTLNYEYNPYMI